MATLKLMSLTGHKFNILNYTTTLVLCTCMHNALDRRLIAVEPLVQSVCISWAILVRYWDIYVLIRECQEVLLYYEFLICSLRSFKISTCHCVICIGDGGSP
jgi:hypothetical protein